LIPLLLFIEYGIKSAHLSSSCPPTGVVVFILIFH
jgi:hypothetical protein